ncbi:MAG: hypothetical protein FDZ72_15250 [Betaproteobacteria bacterium]|nr:MAG: hypothetical protein FDZ72_15250 [Betaproteobacteria bacterium]
MSYPARRLVKKRDSFFLAGAFRIFFSGLFGRYAVILHVMNLERITMDSNEIMRKIEEEFGSRMAFLGNQILMLSLTGQPCDVTFYKKKPALNVKIDQKLHIAIMYGAGAAKLKAMLESIHLSNGDRVSIAEIWTVNPMPADGLSEEDLAAIDLADGEEKVGPNGETLRQMVSETYHCATIAEEDFYLRRFIAS